MEQRALIFDIKRDCSEDGPGIRTTVFFKGCPLECIWCQNPEGLGKPPELSYKSENDSFCTNSKSPKKLTSYWITLQDLLYKVTIDEPFFKYTGGGVTLSGGEATMQMDFIKSFLKKLKKKNIHTALETCGFFNYRRFSQQVLPHLDLIYFDLKLINESESRLYTGQTNKLILDNFSRLVDQETIHVIPRIPLIPNITATKNNLSGIARFLNKHSITSATLLPYNPLFMDKLATIGKTPQYKNSTFMTKQELDTSVHYFKTENPALPTKYN